jgi:predicted ATP-dependent endonuclease of OLD family
MPTTRIKAIHIKKFRALETIDFDVGTQITVVCGKNGTSKSSILGIAAQIFSFEENPLDDTSINFKTISGQSFKSFPSEHFRFSEEFDPPGSMDISIDIVDGYTGKNASPELRLYRRGKKIARPVVRNNDTIPEKQTSRNLTHPVIYLSLKRLMPIALREGYKAVDLEYLNTHRLKFVKMNNELLGKRSRHVTATGGMINSAVAFGDNYDQDSVSAGEDNAGQIVLALMSFRKLKDEYKDYNGGLLLIDEADAGLFPAAQANLIQLLVKECEELNIQVIMTSHSPTIIEKVHELSKIYQRKFKTIYLSNAHGAVEVKEDYSWTDIYSDLMVQTIDVAPNLSLPKVNVYFEDREGYDLFNLIFYRSPIKQLITTLDEISLGCGNYLHLIKHKIPEFTKKSLIVLDGDVENAEAVGSVILLPSPLAPDKIIFEFLYNLPANDPLWVNRINFNKPVFDRISTAIIDALEIEEDEIDLMEYLKKYYEKKKADKQSKEKLRTIFKDFYKHKELQKLLKISTKIHNPWKRWISENVAQTELFRKDFKNKLVATLEQGYGVERAKLSFIVDL